LLQRLARPNLAALVALILVAAVIIVPGIFLARALVREATDVVGRFAANGAARNLQPALEQGRLSGPILRWLDARVDLPGEAAQLTRSLAGWISSAASAFIAGSMWVLTQVTVTLFVLFYFLRDGETILAKLRIAVPLPSPATDRMFARISQTIRISLGGKLVVASIQGFLGGLMFFWLGLPAPVFWGFVMAVLSVFPVIGAFLIWGPAAAAFALQGDWRHALLLVGWGVLIIHPVDNLLGPVLVGTTLRLHTLLMFFSIIGGLAAFGASGIVLGPVIMVVAVSMLELSENSHGAPAQE
jgi:predicted PurR-regulated permease PerM